MILGIDCSTKVCSIAIFDRSQVVVQQDIEEQSSHASQITLMIDRCCKEADVSVKNFSAICVASGPGSYTGLRIAASVAKGLCFGLDIPLIEVDSLTSLAYSCRVDQGAYILAMIDARHDDVYLAKYDSTFAVVDEVRRVTIDQSFFDAHQGQVITFCGDGYSKFGDKLAVPGWTFGPQKSAASNLRAQAWLKFDGQNFVDHAYFSPFYLNPPNITTPTKNKLF